MTALSEAARAAHDAFFRTERYDDRGKLVPPKAEELWNAVAEAVLATVRPENEVKAEALEEAADYESSEFVRDSQVATWLRLRAKALRSGGVS